MVCEARDFIPVVVLVLDLRGESRDAEDEVKVRVEYDVVAAAAAAVVVKAAVVSVEGQNRGVRPARRAVEIAIGQLRSQGAGSCEALLAHLEPGLLAWLQIARLLVHTNLTDDDADDNLRTRRRVVDQDRPWPKESMATVRGWGDDRSFEAGDSMLCVKCYGSL